MKPRLLEIATIGELEEAGPLLLWLGGELSDRFALLGVELHDIPVQPDWKAPDHATLASNRIIDFLVDRAGDHDHSHEHRWTLAVTASDLSVPGRDYVFGEATLGGGWAVVSIARLRPAEDTRTDDPHWRQRLLVEAVHELGHLAGLPHCETAGCAMQPSVTALDIDDKNATFCARCDALLRLA